MNSCPVAASSTRATESAQPTASCRPSDEKLTELTQAGRRTVNTSAAGVGDVKHNPPNTATTRAIPCEGTTLMGAVTPTSWQLAAKASGVPRTTDAGPPA